jgi:hypothetical protein
MASQQENLEALHRPSGIMTTPRELLHGQRLQAKAFVLTNRDVTVEAAIV